MIDAMFLHEVSVETLTGPTPTGQSFAAPVTIRGWLDDGLMVTSAPGGEQFVSRTMLFTHLGNASLLTPGSRVTCNGQTMQVDAVRRRDGGGLLDSVAHLEVDLS